MKIRHKETGSTAFSTYFNTHSLSEIIVTWDEGEMDSDYMSNYDVLIKDNWIDLREAFKNHLVIPDNYNTRFREPITQEEKTCGWYY